MIAEHVTQCETCGGDCIGGRCVDEARHGVAAAHVASMSAKDSIFRAQDALSRAWSAHAEAEARGDRDLKRDRLLRKMERRLARCRTELEQLDNEALHARRLR